MTKGCGTVTHMIDWVSRFPHGEKKRRREKQFCVKQALVAVFVLLILWYVTMFKIVALYYPQRGDTESDQDMLLHVKKQNFLRTHPVPVKGVIQTNFHLDDRFLHLFSDPSLFWGTNRHHYSSPAVTPGAVQSGRSYLTNDTRNGQKSSWTQTFTLVVSETSWFNSSVCYPEH